MVAHYGCGDVCAGARWRRLRGGFTLIELLVVIGIIAVLAAIIIPVYGKALEKSRQTTCLANLHAIGVAMKMYYMDYKAYPPAYNFETGTGGISALYDGDYIDNTKSLRCPNDPVTNFTAYQTLYKGMATDQTAFDTRWTQTRYFAEHYSSYNQDCSTLTGAPGNPDVDSSGTFNAGDKSFVLYNYYGYDQTGHEDVTATLSAGTTSGYPPDAGYDGVKYARLMNNFAPENTIITHCPHHRGFFTRSSPYTAATAQDIVVRLSGSADLEQVNSREPQQYWVDQVP